jgi:NAD+ synthase
MQNMFDAKNAARLAAGGIRAYLRSSKHSGVVIGVSGGIDSAVCAMLASKALGKKNVLALIMPSMEGEDVSDAILCAKAAGIKTKTIDISGIVRAFEALASSARGKKCSRIERGNVAARMRMLLLYSFASCNDYLVLGTGNKTELLLGYFTKHGDGGVDLLPIGDLYKWQVNLLAKELKVPKKIIKKKPSAGLWAGQTDEGELGFSYEFADRVLSMFLDEERNGEEVISQVGKAKQVKKIYELVRKTSHKRSPPRIFSMKLGRWQ